ncbi:11513_t:CDS:2 [Entrophospora sp. SA101]|nr:11513_t:CDS:2 [Entrophospora sp. SA101]
MLERILREKTDFNTACLGEYANDNIHDPREGIADEGNGIYFL